jgi:methyl-accepting chemotaxis protein
MTQDLEKIFALARQNAEAVAQISNATQQQQSSSDQLASAMSAVLDVTQQTLASSKQMASSSGDLAALARDLKGVVERFRVEG